MFEIILQGVNLDLPDDISFQFTIENPLLLVDRIPSPYSLTFELPFSPKNLATFKYPNRITSKGSFKEYSNCELRFSGVRFSKGSLLVQKTDKNITCFFSGLIYPENVMKTIDNVELEKYHYGINADAIEPGTWKWDYKEFIHSTLSGNDKFVAAPIRIKEVDYPFPELPHLYGGYRQFCSYVNFYNTIDANYLITTGATTPIHSAIFPQPFVSYLFDMMFGETLVSNPFKTGELAKLVMLTSYYADFFADYIYGAQNGIVVKFKNNPFEPWEHLLDLNAFMPSVAANEFIKDMLKIICASLYIENDKYSIQFNTDILNLPCTEDWSDKLIDNTLIIEEEKGKSYQYGYGNSKTIDTPSSYYIVYSVRDLLLTSIEGENIFMINPTKEVFKKKKEKVAEVDTTRLAALLDDASMSAFFEVMQIYEDYKNEYAALTLKASVIDITPCVTAYVAMDNYWDYGNGASNPTQLLNLTRAYLTQRNLLLDLINANESIELIDDGLSSSKEVTGDSFDMKVNTCPLPMQLAEYWSYDQSGSLYPISTKKWLVPSFEDDRYTKPKKCSVMLYHGLKPVMDEYAWIENPFTYPVISAHNYHTNGTKLGNLSLAWDAEDGLINTYHLPYKQWVEKDKIRIQGEFLLSILDLKNLNLKTKKHINGRNFFIEKIQVTIHKTSIEFATIDLIEG